MYRGKVTLIMASLFFTHPERETLCNPMHKIWMETERDLRDTSTICNIWILVWIQIQTNCKNIYKTVGNA